MTVMLKILHLTQSKKIFNELVDKRCEKKKKKKKDLDRKVNRDDLIQTYKGNTSDLNFDEFDNALNIINKIQNGEIKLENIKYNHEQFISYLREVKK